MPGGDPEAEAVLLAAARALLRARSAQAVTAVLACAVADLGGTVVPARVAPPDALPVDVSLGVGEPHVVAVDDVSVAALRLSAALPRLVEDARAALSLVQEHVAPAVAVAPGSTAALCRLRLHGTGALPRAGLAGGAEPRDLVASHRRVLAAARAAWGDSPGAEVSSTTLGEVLAVLPSVPPQEAAGQAERLLASAGAGLPWHAGVAPLVAGGLDRALQTAARALVRARSGRVPVAVEGA